MADYVKLDSWKASDLDGQIRLSDHFGQNLNF